MHRRSGVYKSLINEHGPGKYSPVENVNLVGIPQKMASTIEKISCHRPLLDEYIDNQDTEWVDGECMSDLDFADDIAALSLTTQGFRRIVESVNIFALGLGIVISNK